MKNLNRKEIRKGSHWIYVTGAALACLTSSPALAQSVPPSTGASSDTRSEPIDVPLNMRAGRLQLREGNWQLNLRGGAMVDLATGQPGGTVEGQVRGRFHAGGTQNNTGLLCDNSGYEQRNCPGSNGFLFEPNVRLRIDGTPDRPALRREVEAGGVTLYHNRAERNEAVDPSASDLAAHQARNRAALEQARQRYEQLLAQLDSSVPAEWRAYARDNAIHHGPVNQQNAPRDEDGNAIQAPAAVYGAIDRVKGDMQRIPGTWNESTGRYELPTLARVERAMPGPDRILPSRTFEYDLMRIQFRHSADETVGTEVTGVDVTPLAVSTHAALDINGSLFDVCANIEPARFLLGQSSFRGTEGVAEIRGANVDLCAGARLGELGHLRFRGYHHLAGTHRRVSVTDRHGNPAIVDRLDPSGRVGAEVALENIGGSPVNISASIETNWSYDPLDSQRFRSSDAAFFRVGGAN